MSVPGPNICVEAVQLVLGDRRAAYGHPLDDWTRTAALWSQIVGVPVTWREATLCMIAVKSSRQCHADRRDNLVDICGYALCYELCEQEEARRAEEARRGAEKGEADATV